MSATPCEVAAADPEVVTVVNVISALLGVEAEWFAQDGWFAVKWGINIEAFTDDRPPFAVACDLRSFLGGVRAGYNAGFSARENEDVQR